MKSEGGWADVMTGITRLVASHLEDRSATREHTGGASTSLDVADPGASGAAAGVAEVSTEPIAPTAAACPPPGASHEKESQTQPWETDRLRILTEAVARVEEALQLHIATADQAGRFIDRLEEEVRRLRQREDDRRLEPAVKGVISLYDQIGVMVADVTAREPQLAGAERELARTIVALEKQTLELLNRLGAAERRPELGNNLDARWQEVVGTIDTPDPARHLTVAGLGRPGFDFAGRVCRPASVRVFTYTAPTPEPLKEK